MDPTEDLSARVLLTQILSTETPRTPFTRSASQQLSASATRRSSSRLRNKDAVPQTPKAILKQSQIHKLRKSISMQSLNATRRVTRSVSFRSSNIPPVNSMLLEDGETPRHLLKNILQTEPVSTPMVHGRAVSDGRQSSSADSSKASTQKRLNRKRHLHFDVSAFEKRLDARSDLKENKETEQSSLTLSSPTLKTPFVEVQSERMGLRRRALQRRRISVAGFDAAVDRRSMEGETSRWSLSKTTSSEGFTLGLSTFCDSDITSDIIHCDKALCAQPGAMTDNLSIAATRDTLTVRVEEDQMEVEQDQMEVEQDQVEEDQMEVEQDQVEVDQVEVEQDQVEEEEDQVEVEEDQDQVEQEQVEVEQDQVEQDQVEVEQDQVEEDQLEVEQDQVEQVEVEQDQVEVEQYQVEVEQDQVEVEEDQVEVEEDQVEVEEDQVEVELGKEKEEEKHTGDDQMKDNITVAEEEAGVAESLDTVMEEEENNVEAPTEEEGEADSQNEENAAVRSPSEEEEAAAESQTEEEQDGVDSQVEENVVPDTQTEEEEVAGDSQTEEQDGLDCEPEEVAEAMSQSEEEEVAPDAQEAAVDIEPEEDAAKSPSEEEEETADDQSEQEVPAEEVEDDLADSQPEDKHDGKPSEEDAEQQPSEQEEQDLEHTSRRAPRSEGPLGVPVTEAAGDLDHATEEGWSDAIPSKTPAFVRQKMSFFHPKPQNIQASRTGEAIPVPKPKPVRKKRKGPAKKQTDLPKSYLMDVFKHFAKTKVSPDVYPVLKDIMDKYFDRLAEDLETYALHAKRKIIEVEDAELLLRRQGHVTDTVPVEVLIEKYLRMEQRKLLIPIATSGNVVIPKKR
ncbi:hypothetical protein KUCAC02_027254 [Chaenocephalus aceratus]|uniref:Uncharacterized protein n=1 Tax=Chaenocephalus aceratus TaxID=36190 RepID=A0ACB9W361_CHAAC|nr:hypothetical protein KUCAC02_027254 [Chaenocephalus aceratus]